MPRNPTSQASDSSSQVRTIAQDELRPSFRSARLATRRLMAKLDAAGAGQGRAIELVDEALEILAMAEDAHFRARGGRLTEAVRMAVEHARDARRRRGRD